MLSPLRFGFRNRTPSPFRNGFSIQPSGTSRRASSGVAPRRVAGSFRVLSTAAADVFAAFSTAELGGPVLVSGILITSFLTVTTSYWTSFLNGPRRAFDATTNLAISGEQGGDRGADGLVDGPLDGLLEKEADRARCDRRGHQSELEQDDPLE